ncbi:hypothetical protein ACI8AA_14880 [Geodermatophilus sp. SYSU D01180]
MLTAFAALLVTGRYYNEGPVLVRVTAEHGLHRGDVFVVTGWAAGMLSLVGLLAYRRREAPPTSGGGSTQQGASRRHAAQRGRQEDVPVLGDEHVERQPGRPEEESHGSILGRGQRRDHERARCPWQA